MKNGILLSASGWKEVFYWFSASATLDDLFAAGAVSVNIVIHLQRQV
jgi:hypothetical protein